MDRTSEESGRHSADETTSLPAVSSTGDVGDGDDDALAKGLSAMLSSVLRDFDSKAQDALRSQDELSCSLDRLIQELDQLLENAPLPFILQHAFRISGVRKRVSALNLLLKSIQRRVDNVDQMLSDVILHENSATESS